MTHPARTAQGTAKGVIRKLKLIVTIRKVTKRVMSSAGCLAAVLLVKLYEQRGIAQPFCLVLMFSSKKKSAQNVIIL